MVVTLLILQALPTTLLPQASSDPMSGTACAEATDRDTSDPIQCQVSAKLPNQCVLTHQSCLVTPPCVVAQATVLELCSSNHEIF